MQLTIRVPEEKAGVVRALDEAAKRAGREPDELALEAIEAFLAKQRPKLGVFHLGTMDLSDRDELYLERLDK